MKLRWTRLALQDLAHALAYVHHQNASAASAIGRRIEKSLYFLENHPHMGRIGRLANTRELIIVKMPFILSYRICDERVEVLAFLHISRRWPDSF